jgi:Spy/CpxP family protein refolding chaperone
MFTNSDPATFHGIFHRAFRYNWEAAMILLASSENPMRLCTLLCVFCLTPLIAIAQPATQRGDGPPRGGAGGGRMLERVQQLIDQDLQLSDAQRDKIKSILEDARAEMRELMPQLRDLEPQERAEKMREFLKEVHDNVAAELDDSQKKVFEEKLQQLRPGQGGGPGGGGQGGMMMFERLENAVKQLDLSDEQKQQVEKIVADAKKKIQESREKIQNGADPQQVREEVRQASMDVREQLMGVLTPEQQQKLRESLRPQGNGPGGPPGGSPGNRPGNKDATPPSTQPAKESAGGRVEATPPPDTPLQAQVGSPAPDFNLQKLDGKTVQLSSFRNRIVVLVFGSASSPSFRDKATKLEEIYRDFGPKITFFVIYTKEFHAADEGEVDRNKDSDISVQQPKSLADRVKLGKQTRDGLKLTIPFLVDLIENTTVAAYGAGENAAFVIGGDGKILVRQNWCDPFRLRPAIQQALKP